MFSRFDPAAKRVLRAAEQACRNHNHYYVGVEHLLLALLEEHDPDVDARVAARGLAVEAIGSALRRSLGTGDDRLWDGILVTPRVRAVIRLAESSAGTEASIAPVHLFDAIVADGGLASDFLSAAAGNFVKSRPVAG